MEFIKALAAGLGVMLCAEPLIVLGNTVGYAGPWFLGALVLGFGIHLFGATRLFGGQSSFQAESEALKRSFGSTAAVFFPTAARIPFTLMAATGLLATAGYVFNEVFVYWFPNFLFSFALLGLILIVNLSGQWIWGRFQVLALGITCAGLVMLIVAGLLLSPPPSGELSESGKDGVWMRAILGALLLPIGYDLALPAFRKESHNPRRWSAEAAAVIFGGLMLLAWAVVSLRWVASADLAESTIPYTVAARTIMGQEGRAIMGCIIIAGVCGAVNALFGGITRMLNAMGSAGLLPCCSSARPSGPLLPVVLLVAATAGMLGLGMAGSSHLKAYLNGALILWLLHYALLHLAAWQSKRKERALNFIDTAHVIAGLIFLLGALGLLLSHEQRAFVATFVMVFGAAAFCWALWSTRTARRKKVG